MVSSVYLTYDAQLVSAAYCRRLVYLPCSDPRPPLFQVAPQAPLGIVPPDPAPTPVGEPSLTNGVAALPPPVAPPAPTEAQLENDEEMDDDDGAYTDNMQVVWPPQ